MIKHAPAPWRTLETGLVLDANGKVVVPDVYGTEQDEVNANARLIAAAPELLKALRYCIVALECGTKARLMIAYEARKVLALAEGK